MSYPQNFYAQKDYLGFPIPGTMMSVPYGKAIPKTSIAIPAADVTPGNGQTVVAHKDNLRYFVRKDQAGNIIPNSLFTSYKTPTGLVYEFKLVH